MDVITLTLAKNYTNKRIAEVASGFVYKGAVNYRADLDNIAAQIGYIYTVKYKGTSGTEPWNAEFVYGNDGGENKWIQLGADYDAEIAVLKTGKQDKLTAGTNITIENNVISATGGGEPDAYIKNVAFGNSSTITFTKKDDSTAIYTPAKYVEMSGVDGSTGTLTQDEVDTLKESELNYVWLNGMHRLDFKYRDNGYNRATYAMCDYSDDGIKIHSIQVNLSEKSYKVFHRFIQENITDLATIRSGAALGATAIQNVKTVNGQEIKGTGNINVGGFIAASPISAANFTELFEAVRSLTGHARGSVYESNISGAVLPSVITGEGAYADALITFIEDNHFIIRINNVNFAPYIWEVNSWEETPEWKEIVTNKYVKTINGESVLGSGNIEISGRPDAYLTDANVTDNVLSIKDKSGIEIVNCNVNYSLDHEKVLNVLNDTEKAVLNSGITTEKVATYDGYAATIAGKQDTLVSGTNIKTINGNSVLGEGEITIPTEPENYIKDAAVADNTLTLTKKDSSTVSISAQKPVVVTNNDLVFEPQPSANDLVFLTNQRFANDANLPYGAENTGIVQFNGTVNGITGIFQCFFKKAQEKAFEISKQSNGNLKLGNGTDWLLFSSTNEGKTWEMHTVEDYILVGNINASTANAIKNRNADAGLGVISKDESTNKDFLTIYSRGWNGASNYTSAIEAARFGENTYNFVDTECRGMLGGLKFVKVDTLPTDPEENTIYIVL